MTKCKSCGRSDRDAWNYFNEVPLCKPCHLEILRCWYSWHRYAVIDETDDIAYDDLATAFEILFEERRNYADQKAERKQVAS